MFDGANFPDWHDYAACNDKPNEWFYGQEERQGKKRHRPTLTVAEVRRAKAVCERCPVIDECLEWALETDEKHGIWGGTTGRERQRMQRQSEAS